MNSQYLLKYHEFYLNRIHDLEKIVKKLSKTLPKNEFIQHPTLKLAARLFEADNKIIPENPNHPDYYLKGALSKFRRFKKGLQRFRLLFCFSSEPKIIIYLYVNDIFHLRKDNSASDPYQEFIKLLETGLFDHNPQDPKIKKWIQDKR